MISVIVPYAEDNTYLIRCVNSIMRQSYTDIEIIIVAAQNELPLEAKDQCPITIIKAVNKSPYAGISEAIQQAAGEYIFFNCISSVLAPNTLAALLEFAEEEQNTFCSGGIFLPSNKEYIFVEETSLSWCGKLFRRDSIIKNQISVDESSNLAEIFFVSEYLMHYESYKINSEVFIYEMPGYFPNKKWQDADNADWEMLLLRIAKLQPSVAHAMAHSLAQFIQKNNIVSEEMLVLAEHNLHNCFELNFVIAKPFLQQWWLSVSENNDEEKLGHLREYLHKYEEHPDFIDLLLETIGLTYKQYPYLSYENPDDVLYLIENSNKKAGNPDEIEETISSMQRDLEELRQTVNTQVAGSPFAPVGTEATGYGSHILNLEDHIITECREGRVGLRTIMKFFKGWITFKFHRDKGEV